MTDNFFKEENMDQQSENQVQENSLPEAIKVGDKAYTQEELQNLVGLGQQAPDHYFLLSHLLDLSVSQLSTLMPLHYRHDVRP